MATKAAKRRKNDRLTTTAEDPLERALRGTPRCQCRHGADRCPERATHRVSLICVAEGCTSAVHVYLVCADCKDTWLEMAASDPRSPEMRVVPL